MKAYDKITQFTDGSGYVCLDGKWGYINKDGKEIIPCKYDSIDSIGGFQCRFLLWVKIDGKIGVVDQKTGKEIIPCKYDFIDEPIAVGSGGNMLKYLIKISINNKFGFIKPFQEMVKTKMYDEFITIDYQGQEEAISPRYENATRFAGGLAAVQLNGKWGIIDGEENAVVPFIHNEESLKEACGEHHHVFQFSKFISEGMNMDEEKYACVRCGFTKIEQNWHWRQD